MSETTFDELGYLSSAVDNERQQIRAENKEWFRLADDLNALLMCIATRATSTVRNEQVGAGGHCHPHTDACSCGSFQAGILTAERGMTAEARNRWQPQPDRRTPFVSLRWPSKFDEFLAMLKEDLMPAGGCRASSLRRRD